MSIYFCKKCDKRITKRLGLLCDDCELLKPKNETFFEYAARRLADSLTNTNEISKQINFSVSGHWAVVFEPTQEVIATFMVKWDAVLWVNSHRNNSLLAIQPIGAKVDFSEEQIQKELTKRCAEREKANAFSNCNL